MRKHILTWGSWFGVSAALMAAFFISPFVVTAANTASIQLIRSSTQYLSANDASSLSVTDNFSLEAWVKFNSLPPTTGDTSMDFISHWDSSVNQKGFMWRLRNQSGNFFLDWENSHDGTSESLVSVPWTPSTGIWYHVAVTFVGGTVKFYVNGAQQGSDQTSTETSVFDNTVALDVGSNQGPHDLLDGTEDDVRIWNTVLPQSQITAQMSHELTGSETGLVAYWKLNNDLTDSTVNGNTLSNVNAAAFSTDVPFVDDTTPPSISITSPVNGSTVSGTVTLFGNAFDNVGVAGVQFIVDGTDFGTEDTTAPYSLSLDTTTLTNGTHTAAARARDTSGNTTTSTSTSYTVNNVAPFVPILKVRKSADESVTSSTALQNDDQLVLSLDANTTYIFDGVVVASTTNATPDIKISFAGQPGTSSTVGYVTDTADGVLDNGATSGDIALTATAKKSIHLNGTIVTGSTTGNFQLKWAQNASNTHPTWVLKGSYLRAEKI